MSSRLRIAAALSLALHLSIAAAVLLFGRRPVPAPTAVDKPVAVELVMQEQKGAGKTAVRPPEEPSPPQQPQQPPPSRTESEPAPTQATPPPTPPVPPAPQAATAGPTEPNRVPEINIGGTDSESNAIAMGGAIVPASPDKKSRNRPPVYPEEAARRGQQGNVELVVHVGPSGLPSGVDVRRSSGYALLDKSAENAVMKWTFIPAMKDGLPVSYDFTMNFSFSFE